MIRRGRERLLSEFKNRSKVLTLVAILALASSLCLLYFKIKSDDEGSPSRNKLTTHSRVNYIG